MAVGRPADGVFLRAERPDDGKRPFRLDYGEPMATSFGQNLFAEVIGEAKTLE